jgi:hypothetical protein
MYLLRGALGWIALMLFLGAATHAGALMAARLLGNRTIPLVFTATGGCTTLAALQRAVGKLPVAIVWLCSARMGSDVGGRHRRPDHDDFRRGRWPGQRGWHARR